jgi:hypothetical protein
VSNLRLEPIKTALTEGNYKLARELRTELLATVVEDLVCQIEEDHDSSADWARDVVSQLALLGIPEGSP